MNSLLCTSLNYESAGEVLKKYAESRGFEDGHRDGSVGSLPTFYKNRKLFRSLCNGGDVPVSNHTVTRIDDVKLISAIDFLLNVLEPKPGIVRSMTVFGHYFSSMPVLERGGKSKSVLFEKYKNKRENHLGRDTFVGLVDLLSRKSKIYTGLSTYFVDVKHMTNEFSLMMKRIAIFTNTIEESSEFNNFSKQLETMVEFLRYDYCTYHIDSNDDTYHCSKYALGEKCHHAHFITIQSCLQCHEIFVFFPDTVRVGIVTLLEGLKRDDKQEHIDEISNMVDSLPIFHRELLTFAAHKVREKHQTRFIRDSIMDLKNDPAHALIALDHKQKTLPQKFREGQVEYFGKKGLSLLGCMVLYYDETVQDVQTNFIDMAMSISDQDVRQVQCSLPFLLEEMKARFPFINTISLLSDNAPTFSSTEHMSFLYELNQAANLKRLPIVKRWTYSEAQTGKSQLDVHFSYLNILFRNYVLDNNDLVGPMDLFKACMHNGGVTNSGCIFIQANKPQPTPRKPVIKMGITSVHDVLYFDDHICIRHFSELGEGETIAKEQLQFEQQIYFTTTYPRWVSTKAGTNLVSNVSSVKVEKTRLTQTITANENTKKTTPLGQKLQNIILGGIASRPEFVPKFNTIETKVSVIPAPDMVHFWGKKTQKRGLMNSKYYVHLLSLYKVGKNDPGKRVNPNQARACLLLSDFSKNWKDRVICTELKIKTLFANPNSTISRLRKEGYLIDQQDLTGEIDFEKLMQEEEESLRDYMHDLNYAAAFEDEETDDV